MMKSETRFLHLPPGSVVDNGGTMARLRRALALRPWWTVNYFVFYSVKRLEREHVERNAMLLHGPLLDVGCGSRPHRHLLPTAQVGVDTRPSPSVDVCCNGQALPFRSGSFSGVFCNQVLEHVPYPSRLLNELFRVLVPGGKAYIATPAQWYLHYEPFDFYRFTDYSLRLLLEDAGFVVRSLERLGAFPTYLSDRLAEAVFGILKRVLQPLPPRWRVALAAAVVAPLHVGLYTVAHPLDRFSRRDPIHLAALVERPMPGMNT